MTLPADSKEDKGQLCFVACQGQSNSFRSGGNISIESLTTYNLHKTIS